MTVADLIVLVLGVALALSLPLYHCHGLLRWVQHPLSVMAPWWRGISSFLGEAVGKASLALIPLMLYRRARLGGLCRPGELLLPVCAAYTLAEQISRSSCPGTDLCFDVPVVGEVYWVSLPAAGAACAAAVVGLVFVFLREKLSGGALSSLLVVAVAGSYLWPEEPLESLKSDLINSYRTGESLVVRYALFVGFFTLENLVPAVIGAAALSDVIRGRLRTGVMAGIGLAMAAVNVVVGLALYLPGTYRILVSPPWTNLLYLLLAAPVTSGLLGCVLLQVIGPRWRHWCASGEDSQDPSKIVTCDL